MHFDLTDLRLFVLVADEGSLTRAAERQHLSLAAASSRIKSLEEQTGQALFYRMARGVRLTPPGDAFLHHAQGVLRQIHQLHSDMQDYAGGLRGHVRLLANTTAVTDFLPDILAPFLTENPRVNVELQERPNADIARGVLDGRADLGIVAGEVDTLGLQAVHFSTDCLVLVVPSRHPFAQRDALSFGDALDENFVGMHNTSTLQVFINQVTERLGKAQRLRIQVNSFDVLCRMVAAGVGIAMAPESVVRRNLRNLEIAIVPLTDPWRIRKRYILVRDEAKLPSYAKQLMDTLIRRYE